MKPRIKYTISINRSKNGQFFWSVKAGNGRKTGVPGETHKNKGHVLKMAMDLFLTGFCFDTAKLETYPFGMWWSGTSQCRLLIDNTKTK